MKIHKIYYINMDKDLERRAVLEPRIERCFPGIPLERVRGLTPDELPFHDGFCKDRLSGRSKPVDGLYPYPGIVACSLSHRMVLQAIVRDFPDGAANCLVLEDDCVIDETVGKGSAWQPRPGGSPEKVGAGLICGSGFSRDIFFYI